ncbi:MAG: DegV family protein [Anaerolineae bacterium]|uniref:DegV family protein n=1 Tax=Candidatus Amarolinea dominans TaxID=3140696 RepID=UPI00313484AA|nr:DegV family protein [Anaerolineae bacterium]
MLQLVTDSTCDLPPALLAQLSLHVVPITIRFGADAYLEGETIDEVTFYEKIHTLGMIPKTSQPAPGLLADIYRAAGKGGDPVLSLHITSKLSGTVNSAELAKAMVQDEVQVEVFDSMAGSAGLGFMVWEAWQMSQAGAGLTEILARMRVIRQGMLIFLTLQDLRFAQMSGRVSALQFALASLLDVKPIIGLHEGSLDVQGRVRTRKRALQHLLDLVVEKVGKAPINLAVIHARAPDEAASLMQRAEQILTLKQAFIAPLCTSIAANLGPGTLGVVAYPI